MINWNEDGLPGFNDYLRDAPQEAPISWDPESGSYTTSAGYRQTDGFGGYEKDPNYDWEGNKQFRIRDYLRDNLSPDSTYTLGRLEDLPEYMSLNSLYGFNEAGSATRNQIKNMLGDAWNTQGARGTDEYAAKSLLNHFVNYQELPDYSWNPLNITGDVVTPFLNQDIFKQRRGGEEFSFQKAIPDWQQRYDEAGGQAMARHQAYNDYNPWEDLLYGPGPVLLALAGGAAGAAAGAGGAGAGAAGGEAAGAAGGAASSAGGTGQGLMNFATMAATNSGMIDPKYGQAIKLAGALYGGAGGGGDLSGNTTQQGVSTTMDDSFDWGSFDWGDIGQNTGGLDGGWGDMGGWTSPEWSASAEMGSNLPIADAGTWGSGGGLGGVNLGQIGGLLKTIFAAPQGSTGAPRVPGGASGAYPQGGGGGQGMGLLQQLLAGAGTWYGGQQQKNLVNDMLNQARSNADPFAANRGEAASRLMQTYRDPAALYQSPEFQSLDRLFNNQITARDAAQGRAGQMDARQTERMDYFMKNLNQYRQGLSQAAGANVNPGQQSLAIQAMLPAMIAAQQNQMGGYGALAQILMGGQRNPNMMGGQDSNIGSAAGGLLSKLWDWYNQGGEGSAQQGWGL